MISGSIFCEITPDSHLKFLRDLYLEDKSRIDFPDCRPLIKSIGNTEAVKSVGGTLAVDQNLVFFILNYNN